MAPAWTKRRGAGVGRRRPCVATGGDEATTLRESGDRGLYQPAMCARTFGEGLTGQDRLANAVPSWPRFGQALRGCFCCHDCHYLPEHGRRRVVFACDGSASSELICI